MASNPPHLDGSSPLKPLCRIVILGNSQAMVVGTKARTPVDGTYGQLLERRLRGRGIPAQVFHEARWWELIHQLRPRLTRVVAQHTPDVVVLGYGMGECEPNVPPTWLMRWLDFARWSPNLNPAVSKARRVVLPPMERLRMWSYRRIVPLVGMRTWRLRPGRFEAELDRAITWMRRQTGGLILVQTMFDPKQWEELLPGFRERADRFNTIIRDVVARLNDQEVMVVEAGAEIDRLSPVVSTVDGLHYTPAGHAAIATALEDAITRWLASRGDPMASPAVGEEAQGRIRRAAAPRRRTPSG